MHTGGLCAVNTHHFLSPLPPPPSFLPTITSNLLHVHICNLGVFISIAVAMATCILVVLKFVRAGLRRSLLNAILLFFFFNFTKTYIGSVVVSVNPYRTLLIYDQDYISLYQSKSMLELPPHMWVTWPGSTPRPAPAPTPQWHIHCSVHLVIKYTLAVKMNKWALYGMQLWLNHDTNANASVLVFSAVWAIVLQSCYWVHFVGNIQCR